MSCLCKQLDPDQLASEEANWSGSALFAIMWIYINNLDQVIWLAEFEQVHEKTYNKKRVTKALRSTCASTLSDQSSLIACAFYSLQAIQRDKGEPLPY